MNDMNSSDSCPVSKLQDTHQLLLHCLPQLNAHLREMPRLLNELVRLRHLLKLEHPLIQHGFDPLRLHKRIHLPKHLPCPDHHRADSAPGEQRIEHSGDLAIRRVSEDAGACDQAVRSDGGEGLGEGAVPADVDDEIDAFAVGRQGFGFGAPGGVGAVVEGVVGAEVFEPLLLGCGAGGCDDGRAGCYGKLRESIVSDLNRGVVEKDRIPAAPQ